MDQTVVQVTTGRELGSRSSRRLRAEGKLPAVLYGLGKDPISLAVDYAELRDALKTSGMNTILDLDVEGAHETAMVRTVQRDPIKRLVTHVDFLRVDPDQKVRVNIPIVLVGEPVEVLDNGGLVEQNLFELEVEVSPGSIPHEIEVDQSGLTLDTGIAVGDLVLPSGVECLVPEDVSVVSTVVPRATIEAEAEEAAEAEAAAEAGAEGSEGSGDDEAEASAGDGAE